MDKILRPLSKQLMRRPRYLYAMPSHTYPQRLYTTGYTVPPVSRILKPIWNIWLTVYAVER